jgi:hypothetical protein
MSTNIQNHVDYIVSVAGQHGYQLTITRIIKFLYLTDILYVRHTQKTLTEWKWLFWDFGPYCNESVDLIKATRTANLITSRSLPSSFNEEDDFTLYSYPRDQYTYQSDLETHVTSLEKNIPLMVQMGLKSLIKKYGNDTKDLLNYVYYKTEPMKVATPRHFLDFSVVLPIVADKIEPATISRNKEKKARDLIKSMKERMLKQKHSSPVIHAKFIDNDYILGMESLNNLEDNNDINESGFASIATLAKA